MGFQAEHVCRLATLRPHRNSISYVYLFRIPSTNWARYDTPRAFANQAPVRPGDTITGSVEVLEVREDKPITKLATKVTRQDGVVVLEGTALCYTMTL